MFKSFGKLFSGSEDDNGKISEYQLLSIFDELKKRDTHFIQSVHVILQYSWNVFEERFGNLNGFCQLSKKEKFMYLERLLDLENDFRRDGKHADALAVKILGFFLAGSLSSNDGTYTRKSSLSAYQKFDDFLRFGTII